MGRGTLVRGFECVEFYLGCLKWGVEKGIEERLRKG